MSLTLGSLLAGRYRIVRWLAKGGFGAVYLAEDTQRPAEPVAIKESLDNSPLAQAQFAREAQLLARLDHPGLPHVRHHFSLPGQGHYLVMDYIAGDDLRALLSQAGGRLPEADTLRSFHQVLEAVQYLHAQTPPIIHRDIKPANIKLTPQGRAVLVDFGIAKVFEAGQATATAARAISPGYSPIEQYGGQGTDERTDIYALGACLYHLLTGQVPPESVHRRPDQPLLWPAVSTTPHVAAAVLQATAFFPEQRFETVAGLAAALRAPAPGAQLATLRVAPGPAGLTTRPAGAPTWRARTSTVVRNPKTWFWGSAATGLMAGVWWLGAQFMAPPAASPATATIAPTATVALTTPPATLTAPPSATPTATRTPTVAPTGTPSAIPSPTPFGGTRGQWIAFVSMRAGRRQLYLTQADGSGETPFIGSTGEDSGPAWAPNGAHLAFASSRDGNWEIYTIAADGLALTNLTANSADDETPAWSPDGAHVAFTSNRTGDYEIYVMRADGSDVRQLTHAAGDDNFPAWSPDGQWLAFQSRRDNAWTLYAIHPDGTGETRLLPPAFGEFTPAWSPDGTQLAFMSFRAGPSRLYRLDLASALRGLADVTLLSPTSQDDQSPAWSPDGTRLVFTSRRTGDYELYVLDLSDQSVTRLTHSPGHDQYPAWQP